MKVSPTAAGFVAQLIGAAPPLRYDECCDVGRGLCSSCPLAPPPHPY